jgi:hypothetical protein
MTYDYPLTEAQADKCVKDGRFKASLRILFASVVYNDYNAANFASFLARGVPGYRLGAVFYTVSGHAPPIAGDNHAGWVILDVEAQATKITPNPVILDRQLRPEEAAKYIDDDGEISFRVVVDLTDVTEAGGFDKLLDRIQQHYVPGLDIYNRRLFVDTFPVEPGTLLGTITLCFTGIVAGSVS